MNAIEIKNLTKIFRIPHERRSTLFEKILGFVRDPLEYEVLYALKNMSLTIKKGEFVAIMGPNGSGKTVLLKILSKIISPTKGKVKVYGKVVPFLELGTGFQDNLTAKENVYLYGTILGLEKTEIKNKFDSIVDFSGLEKFMDTKLKDFSTGMRERLSFATAIEVEGDIYLVDEALAVGDHEFRNKCVGIFDELKKQGKTLVLVSHNDKLVERVCEKTLILDSGQIAMFGDTTRTIKKYLEFMNRK